MSAYYNENDPRAAEWLRQLIRRGLICDGVVDDRSIEDVCPNELTEFTQCHFFAGIGGWSYALRLADWPDDVRVWTGSCPCQPFSQGGLKLGFSDKRHLWPSWFHLISQCRPHVIFGEQVAAKTAQPWVELVQSDLESAEYRFGRTVLAAAGVGSPHIRERLYFVADSYAAGLEIQCLKSAWHELQTFKRNCAVGLVADLHSEGCFQYPERNRQQIRNGETGAPWIDTCRCGFVGNATSFGQQGSGTEPTHAIVCSPSSACELDNASGARSMRDPGTIPGTETEAQRRVRGFLDIAEPSSNWHDVEWLYCRDNRWRAVEPGTFPLVNGLPGRVGLLRGYGNAIIPQLGAEFIRAWFEDET